MASKTIGLLMALGVAAASPAALADDWVAVSVHGMVMTVKDGHWAHLQPNDAISDRQQIRTLRSGGAVFERDGETVTIAGDTQISISEERGGHYTRVKQWYGTTTVADKEQATPHFEVDTPYLAAVVKGTVFKVWTQPGRSGVNVEQGRVQVNDQTSHLHVDVLPGQHASGGTSVPLNVGGSGSLQPIKDAVGKVVAEAALGATEIAAPAVTTHASSANGNVERNSNGGAAGNGNDNSGGDANGNGGGSGNGDGHADGNGHGR